jgi:DNA-binding transcriptional LysR family regulator
MDVYQLQVVKHILEAGSLSGAASRLDRPQSVISRHIIALEKECGGRIFHRNGRGVTLTALGEKILPQVDIILKASRDMTEQVGSVNGEVAGHVRIDAVSCFARAVCMPMIKPLQRAFPKISLCISENQTGDVEEDLLAGRTDIGIFARSSTNPARIDHIVDEWETSLIGKPGSICEAESVKFSDLAGLPLIVPSSPSFNRRMLEKEAAAIGIRLNIVAEVNGASLLATAIQAGDAYLISCVGVGSYANVTLLGHEVSAGRLKSSRIVEPSFPRVVVVGTARRPSPCVQLVSEYIIEQARARAA